MRLQKFLSRAGVASRRKSEELMLQGRVFVNGKAATELGTTVDAAKDRVEVDGKVVTVSEPEWVALHKPPGYITTRDDPKDRRTVYDLLPPEFDGLFYVGRLDYDSEGLILLTNQGDIAHRMTHPSYGVDREYRVRCEPPLTSDGERALLAGVRLDDGMASAAHIRRGPRDWVRVTLREGRNREVRRMFAAVGSEVDRLMRTQYGPIKLGDLKRGEWRRLDERERAALEKLRKR